MKRSTRANITHSTTPSDEPARDNFLAGLVDVLREQNRLQNEQMRKMLQANGNSYNQDGGLAPTFKHFMGFQPAEFMGSTDPMVPEEWVQSMETIFEFMQINNADRVRCASFMFRNNARIWWQGVKTTLDISSITWKEFKEVFYDKYFTLSTKNKLPREFLELRQGEASVAEYVNSTKNKLPREFLELRQGEASVAEYVKKFERGKYFAPMITADTTMELNLFLEGLNATIRRDVRLSNPSTLRETIDRALMAEKDGQDINKEAQKKRASYQGRDSQGLTTKRPFKSSFNQTVPPQQSKNSWPVSYQSRPQQQQQRHQQPQKYRSQQQQSRPPQQQRRVQSAQLASSTNSASVPAPTCTTCGKIHGGSCLQGSNVCFICKKAVHYKRDCPQKNEVVGGHVYAMTHEEVDPDQTIITGTSLRYILDEGGDLERSIVRDGCGKRDQE